MAIFSRTRDSHTNKKHATIKHGPSDGYYSEFGWYRMLRNWTHVWRTSYMWCCYCSWCRGANQGGTGGDRRTRRAGSMSSTIVVLVSITFLCFCELIYGAKYCKGSYTLDKMSKYKIFYFFRAGKRRNSVPTSLKSGKMMYIGWVQSSVFYGSYYKNKNAYILKFQD